MSSFGEGAADQRRLAVAPRRDQEHFLAGQQVGGEAFQLVFAIDEGRRRHDFAVDEGVLHGRSVTVIRVTTTEFNVTEPAGKTGRLPRLPGFLRFPRLVPGNPNNLGNPGSCRLLEKPDVPGEGLEIELAGLA